MGVGRSVFWDDLASDLEDPEFLREYVAESIRIATIDRIVNELDTARAAAARNSSCWSPTNCSRFTPSEGVATSPNTRARISRKGPSAF